MHRLHDKTVLSLMGIIMFLLYFQCTSYAGTPEQKNNPKIVVDLNSFELRYYDASGKIQLRSIATGGAQWCKDTNRRCKTPSGTYHIKRKYDENYRSGSYPLSCYAQCAEDKCREKLSCGARMPYYIELSEQEHFGIHGGFVPREPLAHVTHSCIRIPWEKALELSHIVPKGTLVVILPYTPIP